MQKVIIILLVFLPVSLFSQKKFSAIEVTEDLDYLNQSLEEAHYDLYAYVSREDFARNFDSVRSLIGDDSLSLLETTSLFQSVISRANNGHTEIPFPGSSYIDYAYSGGTLFPLELAFEEGKVLVRKNWSTSPEIAMGAEIVSINGVGIEEILQGIFPLVSAERRYFKLAKIELISFPRLYWQAYGEQENFVVEAMEDSVIRRYELEAIGLIEDYEMKRMEVFNTDRYLRLLEHAALLNPGSFSGDESAYRNFIDSAFSEINEQNVPNLIIDLRNNLGGDDAFSDYLVSYIADRPFSWNAEFTLKTSAILKEHVRENYDTTQPYWQSVLTHPGRSVYAYEFEEYKHQPENMRYQGEVYVLINRQTHSQSAVTAAQFQDYGFATIVGEETGDYPSLYASQFSFTLPNTGVEVKIAKGYIVRVNGSKKPEGVIPDILIRDHLLDEDDEILKVLLKRLSDQADPGQ